MAPSLTPFDALSVDAFDAAGVSSSGVGVSDGASALSRGAAAAPLGSGMADSPPVTGLPSGDLLGVGSISLPCLGVSTAAEAPGSWTGFEWLPHPMSPSALKTLATRKRDSLSLAASCSRHVSESQTVLTAVLARVVKLIGTSSWPSKKTKRRPPFLWHAQAGDEGRVGARTGPGVVSVLRRSAVRQPPAPPRPPAAAWLSTVRPASAIAAPSSSPRRTDVGRCCR